MTDIEWSDESWNPIRARLRSDPGVIGWHCEHVSPGCEHCYSETRNRSGRCNMGTKLPYKPGHRKDIDVFLDEAQLLKPLGWRKARKVFVCSMTDLFADFVTDEMLGRIFAVMALCPQHTFQVLTKRSARMRQYLTSEATRERIARVMLENFKAWGVPVLPTVIDALANRATEESPSVAALPLPNVWLGVSVEDQQRADERIPDLLATPAAVRWISAEPLLGPVDLTDVAIGDQRNGVRVDALTGSEWDDLGGRIDGASLDWVVVGGESGPGARPMHPDWARSLRDQCAAADLPFFFKQWGQWAPIGWEHASSKHLVTADGFVVPKALADMKRNRYGHGLIEVAKVGKKRAGRLIDGLEYNGMPGQY